MLHLVDSDRADPWSPGKPRELVVDLRYPAERTGDTADPRLTAPYLTVAESTRFLQVLKQQGVPAEVPDDILAQVPTTASPEALPLGAPAGHPLVVLSPGLSFPRATLTGMAEHLASHGYAVALVGHNHEAAGTELPDGRVTGCTACGGDDLKQVVDTRAEDVRFLLDRLETEPVVDTNRTAMVGHSIGGAAAIETLARDDRVHAGANLDGTVFTEPRNAPDRPVLLLGADHHAPGGSDRTWDELWPALGAEQRWVTLQGGGHNSSTDLDLLAERAGLTPAAPIGARGSEISNTVVRAFLDTHLRGGDRGVLDAVAEDHPELHCWWPDGAEQPGRPVAGRPFAAGWSC